MDREPQIAAALAVAENRTPAGRRVCDQTTGRVCAQADVDRAWAGELPALTRELTVTLDAYDNRLAAGFDCQW